MWWYAPKRPPSFSWVSTNPLVMWPSAFSSVEARSALIHLSNGVTDCWHPQPIVPCHVRAVLCHTFGFIFSFCSLLCPWNEPLCICLMSVFLCLEEDYGQPFQSGCLSCNPAEKLKAKYTQIYIYLLLQWFIIRVARDWGQRAVSFP